MWSWGSATGFKFLLGIENISATNLTSQVRVQVIQRKIVWYSAIGGLTMSSNIGPEAQAAHERYENATTLHEKVESLQDFIRLCPKHKATEKILRNAKITLSKLRAKLEDEKQRRKGTGLQWFVAREGCAQAVLLGLSNSGKSTLLNVLTGANAEVSSQTYTTKKPEIGIIEVKGARIQIVELPALQEGASRGIGVAGNLILAAARNATLLLLVIDLAWDPIYQLNTLLGELEEVKIKVNRPPPPVEIQKVGSGGITLFKEELFEGTKEEILEILRARRIYNVIIKFQGKTTIGQFFDALEGKTTYKKGLLIATKGDLPGSAEHFKKLLTQTKNRFEIIPTCVLGERKENLEQIPEAILKILKLIRIYTKNDKGEISARPIVISRGERVEKITRIINKQFLQTFRYAKIWGSAQFEGQRVGIDYQLKEGDIVQIFA